MGRCDSHAGIIKALFSNGDLEVELVDNSGVVVGQLDGLAAAPDLLVALWSLLELLHCRSHLPCHLCSHSIPSQRTPHQPCAIVSTA